MKTISILFISIFLTITTTNAQSFNKEITVETKKSLQGKINKEALSSGDYGVWFTKNYAAYNPSPETVNLLKNNLQGITIKAFMGTWCGDSKKEVPKFYKLLEASNFSLDRLTMVGLSRERETYKQSPGGEEEGLHIARVPTFIFYKDGKEINRFVERPVETLEKDMLHIVQGTYNSSYQIVAKAGNLLTEMGVEKFQKKIKRISKKLKPISKNHHELNGYSSVLFFANKKEESISIAKLNTILFPEEAATFVSLGNKLLQTNQSKKATQNYQKALTLDPENEQAKKAIAQLAQTKA